MPVAALPEAPVVLEEPARPRTRRSGGGTGGNDDEQGGGGGRGDGDDGDFPFSGPKIALALALVASSVLFVVTVAVSLLLRRHAAVWPPEGAHPFPKVLYANTVVLFASSLVLRRGVRGIARGDAPALLRGLALTTALGVAFLAGQGRAWQDMLPVGSGSQATIFYCLTWIHAAHVLGGLVFLGVTFAHAWRGRYTRASHPGVELCELYWHFLLAVWLALMVVLVALL